MKQLHTKMDKHGRLLIPSDMRNALNYKPGDSFVIRMINGELNIISLDKAIKDAQNLFKQRNNTKGSVVDEFLKQKYFEANNENTKYLNK